jgi:hypothetical protein
MMMKHKWIGFAGMIGVAAAGLGAHAGKKEAIGYVQTQGDSATGDLGAVRYNTTTTEFIGCQVIAQYSAYYDDVWQTRAVTCAAYDSTRYVYRTCSSTAVYLIDVASTINGDSRVEFRFNGGECTWISVTNSSTLRPKSV